MALKRENKLTTVCEPHMTILCVNIFNMQFLFEDFLHAEFYSLNVPHFRSAICRYCE